jgi:lysozyme
MTTILSAALFDQIEEHEGFRERPYKDSEGHWTCGIGWSLETGPPMSRDTARFIMASQVRTVWAELQQRLPWILEIDQVRAGVLIEMAFQMGVAGLMGFTKMLAACEAMDWDTAAAEMLASKWAAQTPERAATLAAQMRTGVR